MGFPVFPLEWKDPKSGDISTGYREEGYFPGAVVNMLAFLGWNPGTEQEFFEIEELTKAFELERVHKGGAKFDPEKTKWFQQHYIQLADNSYLADEFEKFLQEKGIKADKEYIKNVVALIKERVVFVEDFWDQGHFFFISPTSYEPKDSKKAWKEGSAELMSELHDFLKSVDDFQAEPLQETVKGWIKSKEIGFGKVMMPLRIALVGALQGPDLYKIAEFIGKKETLKRIQNAVDTLK